MVVDDTGSENDIHEHQVVMFLMILSIVSKTLLEVSPTDPILSSVAQKDLAITQ